MAYVIQDVKHLPNAELYTFNPISAFATFLQTWGTIPEEHKPFRLHSSDVPDHIPEDEYMFMSPEMIEFIGKQFKLLGLKSGWIYNTSRVIEGRYVELIETLHSMKEDVKHFALGPFNPVEIETKSVEKRHYSLEWLDEQVKNSVIYVSFGSTVSMKDDQIDELAKGLEKSGVKFIWVLRGADPNDVFKEGDEVIRPNLLEGYEERVKGRGMVVRDWAPQLEILAHSSVGGFMSHCGWNSCMESISMGVPIAAWPMHSDQPRNAVLSSVGGRQEEIRKLSSCSDSSEKDSCNCRNMSSLQRLPWSNHFSHAFKQLRITHCPEVLCLHLQRSSLNAFGEPVKIQGHICFPIILNLSPFVKYEIGVQKREINKPKSLGEQPNLASISHPKSADKHPELMLVKDDASRFLPEPCSSLIENCSSTISMPTFKANFDPPPPKNILYRLVSVVEHFGRAGSGHYTVYRGMTTQMEKGDGVSETDAPLQWFRISDSEVHNASEEEVLGAEATLLFYERI